MHALKFESGWDSGRAGKKLLGEEELPQLGKVGERTNPGAENLSQSGHVDDRGMGSKGMIAESNRRRYFRKL